MRQFRNTSNQPSQKELERLLSGAKIMLGRRELDKLWRYHNLLRLRNQDRELTRIIGFEPVVIKHYVDSMIVGDLMRLPSPLMDLGTGAGFPGIPLKIRYPNLRIWLAEPRPKRIAFLEEAIKELDLQNATVFEHKVVSRSFQEPVNGVITRAVEEMDKTCLRTSGCLKPGSKLIFMKGPAVDPEIDMVRRRFKDAFRIEMDKAYVLPGTNHQRRLIVLERLEGEIR